MSNRRPDGPTGPVDHRPWLVAWAGFAGLATLNGMARGLYAGRLGDARAHRVSTGTLLAALVPYALAVERRHPVPTPAAAAGIGATWAGLTAAFELGFGHYVARQPWSALLADYDLRRGRLWPLVLVATAAAPAAAREVRLRRAGRARRHGTAPADSLPVGVTPQHPPVVPVHPTGETA